MPETNPFPTEIPVGTTHSYDGITVTRRGEHDYQASVDGTGETQWESAPTLYQALEKIYLSYPELRNRNRT